MTAAAELIIEVCGRQIRKRTTFWIAPLSAIRSCHLLLGLSPVELGGAPFALATDSAVTVSAESLGSCINPGARCYVLPCIAGHVGADCAAVVLSEAPTISRGIDPAGGCRNECRDCAGQPASTSGSEQSYGPRF